MTAVVSASHWTNERLRCEEAKAAGANAQTIKSNLRTRVSKHLRPLSVSTSLSLSLCFAVFVRVVLL